MAMEKAKALIEELNTNPELREKFEKNAKAALAEKDYGCTLDELKEAFVLTRTLDEKELYTITGGEASNMSPFSPIPVMTGDCTADYFSEPCASSVTSTISCSSNDFCHIWDTTYVKKQ